MNGQLSKDFLETLLSSLLSVTHSSPCVIRQKENVQRERKGGEKGKIGVVTLILGVQKHEEQANRNEEPGKRKGSQTGDVGKRLELFVKYQEQK